MVDVDAATKQAYGAWLAEQVEAADVVIAPMPAGLPYDVDLSGYEADPETAAFDLEAAGQPLAAE